MTRTWQARCKPTQTRSQPTNTSKRTNLRHAIHIALALAGPALFAAGMQTAHAYAVNDPITNPVTGATEKVLIVSTDAPWVFTDKSNAIYVGSTAVGTTIKDPADQTKTLTITEVHVNETTNLVDYVITTDGASPANQVKVDFVKTGDSAIPGGDETPEGDITLPDVPAGNSNLYRLTRVGSRGANGDSGYGIHLWFFTIGVDPEDGSPGGAGPTMSYPMTDIGAIDITSVSDATVVPTWVRDVGWVDYQVPVPGAWVVSRGGDGGRGGNSYTLGTDNPGGLGGAAGAGGHVDVTSRATITTSGQLGHGLMVQSIAGFGGDGGDGYLFNSGATGGAAAQGGYAKATNLGTITTFGHGADGMLVQSLGGGGGTGGASFGFVGSSGGGNRGGHGGQATAVNAGTITTMGDASHALVVQSIGGHGGDAGAAGGIVSFGGSGATGGNGNVVQATNDASGLITVGGDWSYGILAQSIGGGGGNGGTAGGIVGIGGSGAGGGSGGIVTVDNYGLIRANGQREGATGVGSHGIVAQSIGGGGGTGGVGAGIVGLGGSATGGTNWGSTVTVNNRDGAYVHTDGTGAYGVLAQSIGGGGGSGATGAGLVGIGAKSGAGGAGGLVYVTNAGVIETLGSDAKAIVAQSIGGGGGSAHGSGGLVSIGGQGGTGGAANNVTVTNFGAILTGAAGTKGSDGVLAQSIGGGGGAGGSSGGLVALGGSGTAGGKAGEVRVTNTGLIETVGGLARGVHVQSIGGGGGSGGDSGGLVSLGGTGSVASDGNLVIVSNAGRISTDGGASSAIEAQSIGGGGGSGGTSGGRLLTIGGNGGGGGNAGLVTLTNSGSLETFGADSHGMLAQSIGGGGGNGGNSVSASAFVGVGIGGKGSGGGDGNVVTIQAEQRTIDVRGVPTQVEPYVHTVGDRSKGILAQSVGGGGGNGGFSVQGTVGYVAGVSVSIGGQGGNGGDGGEVNILGDSTILTEGVDADGIVAQSIGGGGGNGGFAVSIAAAAGETVGIAVGTSVAGNAGSGGIGKTVTLDTGGDIHTLGDQSEGIVAQSIGGSGGNGGFSVAVTAAGGGAGAGSVSVGVGGIGGAGGDAGTVDATWTGNVHTEGHDANAMLLQGVGGGGGSGGFNVSAAVSGAGSASGAVAVGVGGSGGLGGVGGVVKANVTGDITTEGDRSSGLVVQSIGGRGGSGGFNISGTITGSGGASGAVSVGIGGSGGGGGNAQLVDASFTGRATTGGDDADALLFQSVGGSGGNGGFNVSGAIAASTKGAVGVSVGVGGAGGGAGWGDLVTAKSDGVLDTSGARANAFIAQSVGGGGGNGGFNVSGTIEASTGVGGAISVGVGGSGGDGGHGGEVDATVDGLAITRGVDATAIIAQSVGGGGGTGGFNVTGGIAANKEPGGTIGVGVGGSGGGGGDGKDTTLTVTGDVTTEGDNSGGVLAQSLGGGGGAGGMNVTGGVSVSASATASIGVGIGGSGGSGGRSGLVTASHSGSIYTGGHDATAFTAQSIGGGGGSGGLNVTGGIAGSLKQGSGALAVGVGGSGGSGGVGGEVVGTFNGTAGTQGDRSIGVLLQSVGGGGGAGGLNVSGTVNLSKDIGGSIAVGVGGSGATGGAASAVSGTVSGTVATLGDDATGVLVQSVGGGGGAGGINVSGAIAVSADSGAAASIGVGGFGAGGGDGSTVSLTREGLTTTDGANADAVVVQSIGGGGGAGGVNVSGAVSASGKQDAISVSFGLGGFGGTGGDADRVVANVTGDVLATGLELDHWVTEDGITRRERKNGSNAILAQSLGGSGGNGATNVSGGISLTGSSTSGKAMGLNIGVGGFGGAGGDAGEVVLTVNSHHVVAIGDNRSGVIAQSIGGGGGNGGANVSAGVTMNGQITLGVGGFGGDGGLGKKVEATANANINAAGEGAIGFLAQSVGGGGGNGGFNISGGIRPTGDKSASSLVFGLGGFGGDGNRSGEVIAHQSGTIDVEGAGSMGVLAQSIAGGGGNGALNISGNLNSGQGYTVAVGVGGSGGAGANAGNVKLVSDGTIVVDGGLATPAGTDLKPEERTELDFRERANGILAQSIGGGGGNGGFNLTGVVSKTGSPIAVGVGGTGGGGGDAGIVTVLRGTNDAESVLVTRGDSANGLTAQSIGGGGGNAGGNLVLEARLEEQEKKEGYELMIAVGGAGGDPGHGNEVSVTNLGHIETDGRQSDGILAQSVGGGGGNAAFNLSFAYAKGAKGLNVALGGAPGDGGEGKKVVVDHTGTIVTAGDGSSAIFAQSVGGGGGNAETNAITTFETSGSLDVTIGRVGGTGGEGGNVTVVSDGALQTAGNRAVGLFAQSVGNGGGTSGAIEVGFEFEAKGKEQKEDATEVAVEVQVGLEGGEGGTAGNVDVTATGSIMTAGKESHAIQAQSVGGGGGVGGSAGSKIAEDGYAISVGVGGKGGVGAVSGTVDVDNAATLVTAGEGAHGIFAQSIGGGGGVGGNSGATSLTISPDAAKKNNTTVNVSVGGMGGIGAEGNDVTVTNTGSILTGGAKAYGINAQSTGGGGGQGGAVIDEVFARGKNVTAATLDVGGFGGQGGDGQTVTVTNKGIVHTLGAESIGIRAQSLGGGGGDAGLIVNLRAAAIGASSTQTTVLLNVGGEGGTGGNGGEVVVTNSRRPDGTGGIVLTEGARAHGIFAQSLGGGGGNGSSIVSTNLSGGAGSTLVGLNIGGAGGEGAEGGTVRVTNEASIETRGVDAHGVFAQSTGGGGGNGGLTLAVGAVIGSGTADRTPMVALGGIGGDGGNAGDVTVINTGSIVTLGDRSHGIYAQTMGGGGGNAGIGVGLTSGAMTTRIAGVLSATFGGLGGLGVTGGSGGTAGSSTVVQQGDVVVLGRNSRAALVENLNGGGGHVSLDFSGITSFDPSELTPDVLDLLKTSNPGARGKTQPGTAPTKNSAPAIEFRGGGVETQDSSAGRVTLEYAGDFGVAGDDGAGNSAQAVGGGGGTIDLNLGLVANQSGADQLFTFHGALGGVRGVQNDGGEIASRHVGDVLTEGDNTLGVFLQSVGGGGGRASIAVTAESGTLGAASFDVGGTGGHAEHGADVTHEQQGSVTTTGDAAHGVLLQSVGGGGGTLAYRVQSLEAQALAASAAPAAALHLGSHDGFDLDGQAVTLEVEGDTATSGAHATGLLVQSIGGGGGAATVLGVHALEVSLGGEADGSGSAGEVRVVHRGDVTTTGTQAHGVVLQSIGGGGGAVFSDSAITNVHTSSESLGDGGTILYTQRGDVLTTGAGAYGIVAQSLGGGGGFVDDAFRGSAGGAGGGGSITLDLEGNVGALGNGSTALFVQSDGHDGAADIDLRLGAGLGIAGGMGGTAVEIDGGASNTFLNTGTVLTLSGADGTALKGGAGDESVVNQGTLFGNVDLGGGVNSFDNEAGAALHSGTTFDLGSPDGLLMQRGLLAPGAEGRAVTTALEGSFVQTASALSDFELDFAANQVDSVAATGTVEVDGTVQISLLNVGAVKPGAQQKTLFEGAGGLVDEGLVLQAPDSIVIAYDLVHPTSTAAALAYSVDFAPDGLVGNRNQVGRYINRVQAAGSAPALGDTIESLVAQTELAPYADLLTQLGPEFYAEQQALTLGSVQRFTRVLQDCGSMAGGGGVPGCVWMRFDVDASTRDEAGGFPPSSETAHRYSMGKQTALDGDWTLGLGANFEHNDSAGFDDQWRGETTTFQVGLRGAKAYGAATVGGTLSLGNSEHLVKRALNVTEPLLATGNRDVPFVAGLVDVAHGFDAGSVRLTPALNLGVAYLGGEHIREYGAGGDNLELARHDETSAWVEPAVDAAFATTFGQGKSLRLYARFGALYYLTDATTEVKAGFAAAPGDASMMTVGSDLDDVHWLAEGGLELVATDRYTLSLAYGAQRSDLRESDTGTVRIVVPLH